MVLYSNNPAQMYKQLQELQKAAQGRRRTFKLQCHNYVNNADAVPRSLGSSLDALHQAVESVMPSLSVSACNRLAAMCRPGAHHMQCILAFESVLHCIALKSAYLRTNLLFSLA